MAQYCNLLAHPVEMFDNSNSSVFVTCAVSVQGKSGYFWFLYGCELLNDGHRPTFCSPYYPNPSMETVSLALQDAIAALRTGNDTADLAGNTELRWLSLFTINGSNANKINK